MTIKILLLGSGGREHALATALEQDPFTEALYCAPGNPGIAQIAEIFPLDISASNVTEFSFDNSKRPQIAVVRSPSGSNYLLEKFWAGENMLAFYSLDNEARPPIKMFSELNGKFKGTLLLDSYKSIGAQMVSPELTLLVSNFTESTITFNIAPSALTSTTQFTNLLDKASATKAEIRDRLATQAKVKAQAKKASRTKTVGKKRTTITCTKGKLSKKITAAKPKCPAGYR